MEKSPERIYLTDIKKSLDVNQQKHVYRYIFSSMFINGGIVVDCACGSGYGSVMLSEKADKVYGYDISEESIRFAQNNNSAVNVSFKCQSLQSLEFEKNSLQAVVSLETIEHIKKEDVINFLKKSSEWIIPGGCFIGSSPMLRYTKGEPFITNPYHINELPKEELLSITSECFSKFKIYYFHQNIKSFNILSDENTGFCIFLARKL